MNDCLHNNIHVSWAAYRVDDPREAGEFFRSVHLKAHCSECGTPFRFLGDMPLAATSTLETVLERGGAWVSGTSDELGVMIAPIHLGEPLETMNAEGRA